MKGSEKSTTIFHFLEIDEKYENSEETNLKDIKKKTFNVRFMPEIQTILILENLCHSLQW